MKKNCKYWTYERCKNVALECQDKSSFRKLYQGAYIKAKRKNWLIKFCSHMNNSYENNKNRCIYVCIFSNNFAYVGLTHNLKERIYYHINVKKSSIYTHMIEFNLKPEFIQLTDYVNVDIASNKLENFFKTYYEGLGFNMLNKIKTGGVGFHILKYKIEDCHNIALKYNYKSDFLKNDRRIYDISYRYGWLDKICSHMIEKVKSHNYWTKEKCIECANLYDNNRVVNFIDISDR